MNTRCYRCGWSFSFSQAAATAALAELKATGDKYYVEHCPRCRQALKISFEQIVRAVPNPDAVPAAPAETASPPAAPPPPARPSAPVPAPPPALAKAHRKRGVKKAEAPAPQPKSKPGKPAAKPAAPKKPAVKKPAAKTTSSVSKTKKGKKP